jgi:hypothetical protein
MPVLLLSLIGGCKKVHGSNLQVNEQRSATEHDVEHRLHDYLGPPLSDRLIACEDPLTAEGLSGSRSSTATADHLAKHREHATDDSAHKNTDHRTDCRRALESCSDLLHVEAEVPY